MSLTSLQSMLKIKLRVMKRGELVKQKFNLHTHTTRCGHAEGLDIQYVESAIDAGFKMLGFSDHIPFAGVKMPGDRMSYEQKKEYVLSLKELQKKYHGQIDIKIGYEIEYFEEYDEYYLELRKECDYFILGQHLKYMGYEYDCYCSDDDVLSYVQQVENAVKKGFITYIAHPDYFMLGRRQFSEVCREAAHRIARISLDYDVPLEINLNGFRYGKKCYQFDNKDNKYEERYAYPFREFWEIVSTYGCQVLYGYDAHSPIAFLEKDREYKAHEIIDGLELRFVENIILR